MRVRGSIKALAAIVAVVAAPLALLVVLAGPAGAVDVNNDADFRTAWTTTVGPVTINVTGSFAIACTGAPTRAVAGDVTIVGNGFTISTCNTQAMLVQNGAGAVNVQSATLAGGMSSITVTGGGALTLTGSTISGVTNGGGSTNAISSNANVTLVDSTITGTNSTVSTIALGTSGTATLTGSKVTNTTGLAAIALGADTVRLTNSEVSGTQSTSSGALGVGTNHAILVNSKITNTTSGSAGATGIGADDDVTLTGSSITETNSGGGSDTFGINTSGTASLTDSTVSGVTVTSGRAFGVRSTDDTTLVRSTISGISSGLLATGIRTTEEDVSLTNSTITNVGGFAIDASGAVTLVYSDIVHNGGTVTVAATQIPSQVQGSTLTSFASVIVLPQANFQNCEVRTTTTNGYNFADDTTCAFTGTGDRQGAGLNAQLGALAANGGPTQTLLPADASPLVNMVPNAACSSDGAATIVPLIDQRSLPRPGFTGCDIGSVELQPIPVVVILPAFTG